MTTILDSSFIDVYGKQVLWSDDIPIVKFYSASEESWDRSPSTTWYSELSLPNDLFVDSIDSSKWLALGLSSSKTISVSGKVSFSITDDSGSLYLSSDGKWSLTGDFNIRLGIIMSDFYDEYRSDSSFGLNIKLSGNYNIRCALVIDYDDSSVKVKMLSTENADPLFFGWSQVGDDLSGIDTEYLSIKRVGSTISCYKNAVLVGSVSGSEWLSDVSVSIGFEGSQSNTYSMSSSYFSVVSGQLSTPMSFSSLYRGSVAEFPEKVLVVSDTTGLSILDHSDFSLWSRFNYGDSLALPEILNSIECLNGRFYCVSESGLFIVDFVEDKIYKYQGSSLLVSNTGIGLRNAVQAYDSEVSVVPLTSDHVTSVAAKNLGSNEFVALATTSGINLVIDRLSVKQSFDGNPPATAIHFSDSDVLYWSNFNSNNIGDLSYYSNVSTLASVSGSSFSRSGYFDSSTAPYNLTSEHIYSIHTASYGGVDQIALGTAAGVNVILQPPISVPTLLSYGINQETNPIKDPSFEDLLSSNWNTVFNTFLPIGIVKPSNDWSTSGSKALKLIPGSYSTVKAGDYIGVSQRVDFTGVSRIYYDIKRVTPDTGFTGQYNYQILIDSAVVKSYDEPPNDTTIVQIAESIDVSGYTGNHDITIRLIANVVPLFNVDRYALIDNFRTFYSSSLYNVLGGTDPEVVEVFLVYDGSDKKVVYTTSEGYGSVDIPSNTSDFFIDSDSVVSGMVINKADFIEYDSI